jgi:hypothetical protein
VGVIMKTLVIKANDTLIERIVGLFELFPKDQYDLSVISDTSSKIGDKKGPPISLKRGSAKNIVTYIAEDFDEPLEDFQEYMS